MVRCSAMATRFITALCKVLMHLFFSTTKVIDPDRIPASGPVLLVANHHSSLVDPVALIATMPRPPRFLAKAALWSPTYLPLRPFLAAAGAIPVHRQVDGGGDNASMFADCFTTLRDGGVIALFGEGTSHDLPGLLEMKTGAARIALGTDATVTIVPVGLIYDDRATFRSRALATVGQPIVVDGRSGGDEDRAATRALTERIGEALAEVAPTWANWEAHDDANVAARLLVADDADVALGPTLVALNAAVDLGGPEADELRRAVHDLEAEAARHRLDIDTVVDQPRERLGSLAFFSLIKTMFWALPVWVGRLLNWPPFTLIGRLAKRQDLNFQASFKILAGVFVYPLWWIALALVGGVIIHPAASVPLLVGAPILGYLSARHSARLRRFRNRRAVRSTGGEHDLAALRAIVVERARPLAG